MGVGSLLQSYGSQRFNSGHQTWQKLPLTVAIWPASQCILKEFAEEHGTDADAMGLCVKMIKT